MTASSAAYIFVLCVVLMTISSFVLGGSRETLKLRFNVSGGLLDMLAGDRGLRAMDESNPTCNKRFANLRIPQTEETRRAWRELLVTTPGLAGCNSAARRGEYSAAMESA